MKEGRERQRRSIANTLFVGEAGARGEIPMLYSAFEVANTVNHSIEIALCTIVHFYLALSAQDADRLGFLRDYRHFSDRGDRHALGSMVTSLLLAESDYLDMQQR